MCIRIGKTVFKIFIWGGISSDTCSEIMLYGSAYKLINHKLNFTPYIRRYTSPNENLEYSYPLIQFYSKIASQCYLPSLLDNISMFVSYQF